MHQHGSKYFARRSLPSYLGEGSNGQNSTLPEHGHIAYQIKGNHKCSNLVANSLPGDSLPLPLGPKCQTSLFLEHGHVAYQIKGYHKCSNMVEIFCPQTPSPLTDPGGQNSTLS